MRKLLIAIEEAEDLVYIFQSQACKVCKHKSVINSGPAGVRGIDIVASISLVRNVFSSLSNGVYS